MDYAVAYSRAVCYSADHSGVTAMLRSIPIPSWQGRPTADHNSRLAASDYLRDLDRHDEADVLADTGKHAYFDGERVRDADSIRRGLEAAEVSGDRRMGRLPPDERQLLTTALWSAPANHEGEDMDDLYTIRDIEPETRGKLIADWRHFKTEHTDDIGDDPENRASHDFVLSRSDSGAGFHDHADYYGDEQAARLHKAAKKHGSYDLFDNDGSVGGYY